VKPTTVILRHPGRLHYEARECISRDATAIFPDAKVMVLCEGMEAWLLGDDGRVYDLNNSGEFLEGRYKMLACDELYTEPTRAT
jgi:hypothetical protein